ncbi:hypothetical protein LLG96_02620 [bacterium]|nr:hypothetical protein [bacterium]
MSQNEYPINDSGADLHADLSKYHIENELQCIDYKQNIDHNADDFKTRRKHHGHNRFSEKEWVLSERAEGS